MAHRHEVLGERPPERGEDEIIEGAQRHAARAARLFHIERIELHSSCLSRPIRSVHNELLPPSLYGYGVSFVLIAGRMAGRRGETSTAPHLGRFPPGAGRTGRAAGNASQSRFQPTQQHQSRVFISATGGTAVRTLVLPVRERFLLVRQFPAPMTALRGFQHPRRRLLVP